MRLLGWVEKKRKKNKVIEILRTCMLTCIYRLTFVIKTCDHEQSFQKKRPAEKCIHTQVNKNIKIDRSVKIYISLMGDPPEGCVDFFD